MDWDYFRLPGKDAFQLKRLPPITKPFRITDRTDLSDYRGDFKGLPFYEGVRQYQRCFDDDVAYEIEVEETEEFVAKLNQKTLGQLYPFRSDPGALVALYKAYDDEDSVQLDGKLADYALKTGLVSIDPADKDWYYPTRSLVRETERLALDLINLLEEKLKDYPATYCQSVMRVVADELEPLGLFEKAVAESAKSSAFRISKAATADEFGRVRVWPKRNEATQPPEPQPEAMGQKAASRWYILAALAAVLVLFGVVLSI